MKQFLYQLRRVKFREIADVWKFVLALLPAFFLRLIYPGLWIVCEDPNEARDNGYWFFKYVREKHPEQRAVYAINKQSPDYEKIRKLGNVVEYGSFAHYVFYLAAEKKISSQKSGNPNYALFYFLEVYGFLKDKRVYLQHGVIINDLKWLYYDVTKMNRFICGAYPEYKFISSEFGYPKGNVRYTGLCRFDGLHEFRTDRMILIMPTWREWIADEDYRLKEYEGTEVIPETGYFRTWTDFIRDGRIRELAEKYGVKFIFFPHRNMQKYIRFFPESDEYIEIADTSKYDVQYLLKKAAMMITDYSSVFMDMLYMKKPVVFYQFDYDLFRKGQYGEGYFDYSDNPFAPGFRDKDGVFSAVGKFIADGFRVSDEYLEAHKEYFRLYDTDNCKRVYDVVRRL